MKNPLWVALMTLTLNSCVSRFQQENIQSITPLDIKKLPNQLTYEVVPTPPKIHQFNWLQRLQPLLNQMLETKEIIPGHLLLLENIKNNTNGILQTITATSILHTALKANSTFKIFSETHLMSAKQALGLSAEDSLISLSKAIGLARIINAQYLLYSDFSGDIKSPTLNMRLILVKTGEIIWSGHDIIKL